MSTVDTPETEAQLISRAQSALSECRWTVGECAAKWTQRFARGRTDADFANLVGLSVDQVFQRRRTWEVYGEVRGNYPSLKWSHFYSALTWDDAETCLQWAVENEATVAEMRAWRRAQRGEDLTEPAADDPTIFVVPSEATPVQDPDTFTSGAGGGQRTGDPGYGDPVMTGFARQFDPTADGYPLDAPPFDADQAPSESRPEPVKPSTEQVVSRMTSQIERCLKIITPEFCREFRKVPKPLRLRFLKAAADLGARAGELG